MFLQQGIIHSAHIRQMQPTEKRNKQLDYVDTYNLAQSNTGVKYEQVNSSNWGLQLAVFRVFNQKHFIL